MAGEHLAVASRSRGLRLRLASSLSASAAVINRMADGRRCKPALAGQKVGLSCNGRRR